MKPVNLLPPFKRLCVTIGNLPSSYVDSMSYYECLMWLCKYLKDTVIPAINENAEAVNELINWFNNLDVQDEINNKLDEMAEDGTLAEIVSEYLQVKAQLCYDNVSAMKTATNLVDGSYARTFGYYEKGDGGSAYYKVREVINTDEVDDTFLVGLSDENLVAELIILNELNVKQLGAKGDGTSDDTLSITKAMTVDCNIKIPNGTYNINEKLNITLNNQKLYSDGSAELFYTPGARIGTSAKGQRVFTITGNNYSVENITFNANNEYIRRPHQTGTDTYTAWQTYRSQSMDCVHVINSDNIKMVNCSMIGGLIKLHYVTNFILEKCLVKESPADSYYIQDGCHNGLVLKCRAIDNGDDCFSTNVDQYLDVPSNITYDSCYANRIEGAMFCCYGSHDIRIVNSQGDDIRRNGGFRVQSASSAGHDTCHPYNITVDSCTFNFADDIGGNDNNSGRGVTSPFLNGNSDTSFLSNIRINNSSFIRNSGSLLYYLYMVNISDVIIDKCTFKNINLRTIDYNTSKIKIYNSNLQLNQELYIYGSTNFEVQNCNISNDCTQATADVETGVRACIANFASYYNVYRNNTYAVNTDGSKNNLKIASNFNPNGNQLFISDNANVKNYHTNYDYKYVFDIPDIVVTQTITPTSTSRSYVTINYNLDYEPKAVIPVGITPSANADASLNNLMVQSYGKTSAIVRYNANVANLEYKIKLIIIM